jgi:hypothetical protein
MFLRLGTVKAEADTGEPPGKRWFWSIMVMARRAFACPSVAARLSVRTLRNTT